MAKEGCLVFVTSWVGQPEGAIVTYRLNTESGSLTELHRYSGLDNPFYLNASHDKKRLYTAYVPGDFENDNGFVAAFEIASGNGKLTKLNEQPSSGNTTCYVDVDPTGSVVVFANYTSGSIGAYPVQSDGSLGKMSSFVQHHGASRVNESRQEAAHAHCAVISANGRHVYVCDLGMDQIVGYALDVASATLAPQEQPFSRTIAGGGPRHFTYHPNGRFVYANNELTSSVNVFSYDSGLGHLIERQVISSIPDDFDGSNSTADIKTTPDGRHLYCSNRGHDSIAIYTIGDDGYLSLVDVRSSLGNTAQNLAITPDGTTLLCANMVSEDDGENIAVFHIDADTGKLEVLGNPVPLPGPSCIQII